MTLGEGERRGRTQLVRQARQGLDSPEGSSGTSSPTLGGNGRALARHPAQLSVQESLKEECEPHWKAEADPKGAKYRQLNHTPLLIPVLSWARSKREHPGSLHRPQLAPKPGAGIQSFPVKSPETPRQGHAEQIFQPTPLSAIRL